MAGVTLSTLNADLLRAHILDPEHNPLSPQVQERFDRIVTISQYLDEYPSDTHIVKIVKLKYKMSESMIRADVKLARELFKSRFDYDWDFLRAWEIKDQLELVRKARESGDIKAWNDAKKVLHTLIGERPEGVGNGKRAESTVINISISKNGKEVVIPLDSIRDLPESELDSIFDSADGEISIEEAEKILDT